MIHFKALLPEIQFTAVRSRGPGGQNVNKVSSAAMLRWNFETSWSLTPEEKDRLRSKLANHINKEGEIYLRSDESRDLEKNKKRCLEKLEDLIKQAMHEPKKRTATKPTRGSKIRKREHKSSRSEIKKSRQKVRF